MSNIHYHRVPLDEEPSPKSRRVRPDSDTDDEVISYNRSKSHSHWAWLAHAVLLSVSMTFFAISFCLRSGNHSGHRPLPDAAPVLPVIEYETKQAGLGPAWRDSPYAGRSREAEEAWRSLTQAGDVFLTEAAAYKLGVSPNTATSRHPETGEQGYRAGVEVFYQLRCLNLLRQEARGVGGTETNVDIDYCVELLRETLMCHSDAGIFAVGNTAEHMSQVTPGGRLEFEGARTCRSFEAAKKWSDEHGVKTGQDNAESSMGSK
ncbi:hypothetical protein F5144DRAFT_281288 [Chaetomium tenue]|uniref:Uncharacterized protein n=1 Tax=Chaetomium tenue TaxID=1854479 RepID=A0ACB7P168_9PEZI|nr:hypothetical protein F5144DRAFT_281288 [Chaetomium globosum]